MGFRQPGGANIPFDFAGGSYTPPASGSVDLYFTDGTTQHVGASGFDASVFSAPAASNVAQGTAVGSIAPGPFGTSVVQNRVRTLHPEGFETFRHGPFWVRDLSLRIVLPGGFEAGAVGVGLRTFISFYRDPDGNAIYFNFAGDPYTPPAGNAIYGDFVTTSSFRALFTEGIAPGGMGDHLVEGTVEPQTISPLGFATGAVGAPSLVRYGSLPTDNVYGDIGVDWRASASASGDATLRSAVAGMQGGIAWASWAIGSEVSGDSATGWSVAEERETCFSTLWLTLDYLEGETRARWSPADAASVGAALPWFIAEQHSISEALQWQSADAAGQDKASPWNTGTALERSAGTIWHAAAAFSFDAALRWDTGNAPPYVHLARYLITREGPGPESFGAVRLMFTQRIVGAGAIEPFGFGLAEVSNYERRIFAGGPSGFTPGLPQIAHRVRYISPPWFGGSAFGTPLMGFARYVAPAGYDAIRFGGTRVDDNRQHVRPPSVPAPGFGTPDTKNHRQFIRTFTIAGPNPSNDTSVVLWRRYVTPFTDTPQTWGPHFGAASIENRNKQALPIGFNQSRVSIGAIVENRARLVQPSGFDAARLPGPLQIAFRIRSIPAQGIEAPPILSWAVVYNNARLVRPAGLQATLFGAAQVLNRNRTVGQVYPHGGERFGTPFVAYAIRHLSFYQGIPPGIFGAGRVFNLTQHITGANVPKGDETGAHSVHEHFNLIAPRMLVQTRYGEPKVWNKTPQLYQMGRTETLWGDTKIRLQYRFVPVQGYRPEQWGRPDISYRTKTVRPTGFRGPIIDRFTRVALDNPNLPYPRTILPAGFSDIGSDGGDRGVGRPSVRANSIYPSGWNSARYGQAGVYLYGIRPPSIAPNFETQFGIPSVNPTQFLRPTGIAPPAPAMPRLDPYTIWCRFDAPAQAVANHGGDRWEFMDHRFAGTIDSGARPFFGRTTVENKNRALLHRHSGTATPGIFVRFGAPTVALRRQYVAPAGLRAFKQGIPELFGGSRLFQFYGFDMSTLGEPEVAHYVAPGAPRVLRPSGVLAYRTGASLVQLKDRTVRPAGIAAPTFPRPSRIGPPIHPAPAGFAAGSFGTSWVSHFIRTIEPQGADQALVGYSVGSFSQRMRVWHRDARTIGGIVFTAFGTPAVTSTLQRIQQTDEIQRGAMGVPALSTRNIVALGGLGFDSSVFGDVDRWEAGKVKPHGDDLSRYGLPRLASVINTVGINGTLGLPHIARLIQPEGFDSLVAGTPATPLVNPHGCGSTARAIAPASIAPGGFGTPTVQ